jgi:hypothetical protein
MKHVSNEQKADEICKKHIFDSNHFDCCMEMAEWKDKERKELWRITRNHWQEWAEEQLTAFAVHLQKRGAFREDLCMDFEHEAQSFIEMQNNKELCKEL